MAKTNSIPESRAPKAPADYAKKADETELILDGLTARIQKIESHISTLLAGVPQAEAVMQSFRRLANQEAQRYEVKARFAKYVRLRDRDTSDGSTKSA